MWAWCGNLSGWCTAQEAAARACRADVLVRGGDVVTMDGARTVVRDGAVAVRGDVIVAVGPWDRAAGPCTPRRG